MVAIKPPKQIKTPANLKIAVRYILNKAKSVIPQEGFETGIDFPVIWKDYQQQIHLVSSNGIEDYSIADEEMVMTKLAAAFKKGDDDLKELSSGKQVLAHHIIQ